MNVDSAIRKRRSVRQYTDRPVPDAVVDECLRLALLAPTGGMAQAWSFIVVRDPEVRGPLAELVIDGGAEYFATVRPPEEGATAREHARWAAYYAEKTLGTYVHVPVWIVAARVPRSVFPASQAQLERDADLMSLAFAMENLFVAARARGIGTVATVFHWYRDADFRALLGLPDDIEVPVITPFGYPVEFPTSLPPALRALRRPWHSLVFDDRWNTAHEQAGSDEAPTPPPAEGGETASADDRRPGDDGADDPALSARPASRKRASRSQKRDASPASRAPSPAAQASPGAQTPDPAGTSSPTSRAPSASTGAAVATRDAPTDPRSDHASPPQAANDAAPRTTIASSPAPEAAPDTPGPTRSAPEPHPGTAAQTEAPDGPHRRSSLTNGDTAPGTSTPPTPTSADAPPSGPAVREQADDTNGDAAPSREPATADEPHDAPPGTPAAASDDDATANGTVRPGADDTPRHRDRPGHIHPSTPLPAPEVLAAARSELGLSRIEIAEIIGTTPGLVDEWITGTSEPGRHLAEQIEALRGVVTAVRDAMSTRAARVWLNIPSPELDYYTPVDVLRRGELYLLERTLRERPRDITLGMTLRTDRDEPADEEDRP